MSACSIAPSSYLPISLDKHIGALLEVQLLQENESMLIDSIQFNEAEKNCQKVFNTIVQSNLISHKNDFEWRIHFIKDDSTVNAFCLPGGSIFVYTGLLKICESKDEMAAVLAHEIAHAEKRHSLNQLIKQYGLQLVFESILGYNESWLGIGLQLLQLKFSRADESEADVFAFQLLKSNQLDSEAFVSFLKKMNNFDSNEMATFLSTHPETEYRIQQIESLIKSDRIQKQN